MKLLRKLRKITGWLFVITFIAACMYAGIGTWKILQAGPYTSFPWYTAWYFAALFFGPVMLLELILYGIAVCKCRKAQKTSGGNIWTKNGEVS